MSGRQRATGPLLSDLPDLRSAVGRRVEQAATDRRTRESVGTVGTVCYYYQNDEGVEGVTVRWRHERPPKGSKPGTPPYVIADGFRKGRVNLLRLVEP